MNDWRGGSGNRHDVITVRVIWVAFALSLLVHVATLWTAPPLVRSLAFEDPRRYEPSQPLMAQLAPRTSPAESSSPSAPSPPQPSPQTSPQPSPQTSPPPLRRARPPTPAVPAPAPRPEIARSKPAISIPPTAPVLPAPPVEARPAVPPPVEGDLSAYIAARRSARGEQPFAASQRSEANAPPAESENERLNRIVAANLGLNKVPTFGDDPRHGGGVFQLRRMGYDDAEFYFNGWNQDIGRIARQRIEVRKGANPDIRVAVIRRMIDIIRAQESGDFVWVSRRLGRQIALSARPGDNAGLEDFMMREFFGDTGPR